MRESYLNYAMSVIVSRALPDVRDGLKPVHRRILYAMWDNRLTSSAKYRKSATVVGEVLGKYHPHGDLAVYDSLVRMAQPWSMRSVLVDGQGNFGSIDGDSPAAMRYTEARLAQISDIMLEDLDKETVDFSDNYDSSRKEPKVLPSKLPNLLINGSLGIAVGMATNIPTHNIGEICDAIIQLIDRPNMTLDDLMKFIRGPDFPTGGQIFDTATIKQAYLTGKGSIVMRGVAQIEFKEPAKSSIIHISQLPYQVNKADLITRIAELVKSKKIEGITDLRDESDRKQGVRIIIELKPDAYPQKILNQIYDLTPLQSAFHVNMVALIDGIQPRLLTLKEILEEFIKHRQKVIRRRTQFDLRKASERAHILEGLKVAIDAIDAVVKIIRSSKDRQQALGSLIKNFKLTSIQANAILDMRLSQLTNLEGQAIEQELKLKYEQIKQFKEVLASELKIFQTLKQETLEVKNKYAQQRLTKVTAHPINQFRTEDLIPNEQAIVTLTKDGFIKRMPALQYRAQARGGKGVIGMGTRQDDVVEHIVSTWTHANIFFFTDKGRIFVARCYELPLGSRLAKGHAAINVVQLSPEEKITTMLAVHQSSQDDDQDYFVMSTRLGVIKKTPVKAYHNVRKTGIIAISLRPGDQLKFVRVSSGKDRIMITTTKGQSIYFRESEIRSMGRSAAGVKAIKLTQGDEVISMDLVPIKLENQASLLTILENGFGKRTLISKHYRPQKRGGIGVKVARLTTKTGLVIGSKVVTQEHNDVILISQRGQIIRIKMSSIKKMSRTTQGVTLMRFNDKSDKVASFGVVEPIDQLTKHPENNSSGD